MQFTMTNTSNEAANHHKNAINIIPYLSNALTLDGISHDIDFSMFAANYISGIKSFIITMPECYANILKHKQSGIIAKADDDTIYKIVPKTESYVARDRKSVV